MRNKMPLLDWDHLLDGQRYALDMAQLGVTPSQLRAKAYAEADQRRTTVRTHRVPGTMTLVIQAFVMPPADGAPGTVVRQLPPLPRIEWEKGARNFREQFELMHSEGRLPRQAP